MPQPKTPLSHVLPDVIIASVKATTALVLHITGDRRLERPTKREYVRQLKLLLELAERQAWPSVEDASAAASDDD